MEQPKEPATAADGRGDDLTASVEAQPSSQQAATPRAHLAWSAGTGIAVGAIVAGALQHAYSPQAAGYLLNSNLLQSVAWVGCGGLVVAPVVAAVAKSARLLAAMLLAAVIGGPALTALLAATVNGDAAGGPDRFAAWTFVVAAVYALAGALTSPRTGRITIASAVVVLLLTTTLVTVLERGSQQRWRTWDVANYDVTLALPDIPGYAPSGMRYGVQGLHIDMSGPGGIVSVELLDSKASKIRFCGLQTPCWNRPGDRWSDARLVTRRLGGRLIQIAPAEGATIEISIDVPIHPVAAKTVAQLPTLPPPDND
ncbi:hypothetical protein Val02_85630 [Virgisporangium aliadipatigenens]|uniref:Uncharacterized protein n=1 Tax=Virgisporangium aliadipatigenens TaxID=741659 RepID=A0A8J3YVZ7_9ACTN|nr:hypothetical protein [Virgisporangium aliadipatigenens]GIJ51677.1 hypothetical protein Val02_85630 [Virgisporangium aliadipatigenens]